MMASLNQRPSPSSFCSALISDTTFMARLSSRQTTKEQGGIPLLVNQQTNAAPFHGVTFAGDQVFDGAYPAAAADRADVDVAEMEPKLPRSGLGQRHSDRDSVIARDRLLDEADDLAVVDLREAQIARLQESRIAVPQLVEATDIALDIARLAPVARLQLVFLGAEILLPAGNRLVLEQLEPIVDAVVPRKRRGQRDPRLEDPWLAGLQVDRQNVRRVDEEIRPEVFALGVARDLGQIGLQFVLCGAPGEIRV